MKKICIYIENGQNLYLNSKWTKSELNLKHSKTKLKYYYKGNPTDVLSQL